MYLLIFLVRCDGYDNDWKFNHSKLENHQGYLKSNDIINLSVKKMHDNNSNYTQNGPVEFLRGHDFNLLLEIILFKRWFVIARD